MEQNKVSSIEFHITEKELEDFILRAAELIKDGYHVYSVERDILTFHYSVITEPYIHIKFIKNKWE